MNHRLTDQTKPLSGDVINPDPKWIARFENAEGDAIELPFEKMPRTDRDSILKELTAGGPRKYYTFEEGGRRATDMYLSELVRQ